MREPGSFQWCPAQDNRLWSQSETHEIPSEHKKALFLLEDGQTLEQVTQRGCTVEVLKSWLDVVLGNWL